MTNGKLLNIIICGLGFVLILISIITGVSTILGIILISVGSSILASGIVSFLTTRYLIQDTKVRDIINEWGLNNIFQTRAEMNKRSNELLNKTSQLDIIAMGLKGFRDAKSDTIIDRVKKGMNIRLLTLDPKSSILSEIDITEESNKGSVKQSIEMLIKFINELKEIQPKPGQIEIRLYDHYPYDFYFLLDDALFVGPYQDKSSQQTITYEYDTNGRGYKDYRDYFERIWKKYER